MSGHDKGEMLSVRNLVKRYQGDSGQPGGGVFGVDFEVRPGEIFTLLGPSGCGKTTTLRCIAGLELPDSGRIALAGRDLFNGPGKTVAMYDRDIGMVFQSYAIWPHMSVAENAAYPLRVARGVRPTQPEIKRRVDRVLEMVGLARYHARSATQLSGGQQQRLALARALVREPKLLLLDEPLSNLDAQLREQMRGELKRIQLEWGVTTIYVTHDQAEAMAISDRIAVMNQGLIAQIGSSEEIYETPNSEFVAKFIGRTNLFRGKLAAPVQPGQTAMVHSAIGHIRCRFAAAADAGREVSFVIRPENIAWRLPDEAAANAVTGRVTARIYLGEIAEYAVALEGGGALLIRSHPAQGAAPGDTVHLRFPVERTIAICA